MLKRTLIEYCKGYVFRRFEHPTRGTVDTLSYPCGRVVYVAKGFEPSAPSWPTMAGRKEKRPGTIWKADVAAHGGNRRAGRAS
jgi:hypothetical protein